MKLIYLPTFQKHNAGNKGTPQRGTRLSGSFLSKEDPSELIPSVLLIRDVENRCHFGVELSEGPPSTTEQDSLFNLKTFENVFL